MFYLKKIKKIAISRTFLIIVGFYTVFTVFGMLKRIFIGNSNFSSTNWLNFILENFLIKYFLVLIFTTIVLFSCKEMLKNKTSWIKTFCIHVVLAIFLGVFLYFGLALFQNTLIPNFRFSLNAFSNYYINSLDSNFLIYFSIVGIFYALYHIEKEKYSIIKANKLRSSLSNTRLKVLKYQSQPNLLFNGLNNISSLMNNNILLAQNTTADLGDFLRDTIEIKDKNLISVNEEIKLTNKYINILKIRYDDQLLIKFKSDKSVGKCLIPSLLLQPLIENAIKNDLSIEGNQLLINIDILKNKDMIEIKIKSNGAINKNINFNSLKLNNLNLIERLQLIYGDSFTLTSKKELSDKQILIKFPCNPQMFLD